MYDQSCSTSDPKRSWSVKIDQIENVTVKKSFAGIDQTTQNRVNLRYFDWPSTKWRTWRHVKTVFLIFIYLFRVQEGDGEGQVDAPLWMGLLILVFFTALMAGLFCWIEGWDFGTSLYFQYITYLTIGFGDVVPAKEQVKIHAVNNPDLPRFRNKYFGIRDLPYLKAGIRNFKARWRRNLGLKVWMGCVMPKIAIWSTGLSENLGWDDEIKKPNTTVSPLYPRLDMFRFGE